MNLRSFFMAVAVVAAIFALGLLLVPQIMDSTFSGTTSASEMLTDRMLGAAMLTLALIVWLARDLTGASVRPIITGNLIGGVVGFVVALMGTLSGAMQSSGWLTVALYLLFALGFGYFQFVAPPK